MHLLCFYERSLERATLVIRLQAAKCDRASLTYSISWDGTSKFSRLAVTSSAGTTVATTLMIMISLTRFLHEDSASEITKQNYSDYTKNVCDTRATPGWHGNFRRRPWLWFFRKPETGRHSHSLFLVYLALPAPPAGADLSAFRQQAEVICSIAGSLTTCRFPPEYSPI